MFEHQTETSHSINWERVKVIDVDGWIKIKDIHIQCKIASFNWDVGHHLYTDIAWLNFST